ncbi:GerAB/ArcD/ProY family transporter [Alteribacter natronophilus]|uniref:GerAB/ArcD/ProY family transporter n=1 Tax=Alteribacter natronophilus TaxID=2583810 RepID=UPI0014868351|nr:GerAB/ArcD/ProY family transporter [Alteribacter natronophilus]
MTTGINTKGFRSFDIFVFVYCSTVTLGVIFLPYVAEEEIRSAWLKLAVSALPYFLLLYLLHRFSRHYESRDLFKEVKVRMWTWLYGAILLYFFGSVIYSILNGLKGLTMITAVYLLPNTSEWILALTFLAAGGFAVWYGGIETITRFVVLLFFLELIVLFLLIALLFAGYFRWIYIPPVFGVGATDFFKSSISDAARYGGIIAVLGFLPFVRKDVSVGPPAIAAITFLMITYVLVAVITLGTFGFEQSLVQLSPITSLVQALTTRMGVFERLDLVFLGIWVVSFFKIYMIQLWFVFFISHKCTGSRKRWPLIASAAVIVFVLFLLTPPYIGQNLQAYNINVLIYSFVLPLFLLVFLFIRGKRA